MTANAARTAPGKWRTRLLTATLITLAGFPILIFATDATHRGPLVSARAAAMKRAGVQEIPDSVRRERQARQRRRIRPTFEGAVLAMAFQLFWIVAIAVVGRTFFRLRL